MDFGDAEASTVPGKRLDAARTLFDLVDLTTVHLWTIPGKRTPGDRLELTLVQAGSDANLALTLVKNGEAWFIVNPVADALAAARKALLARSGGQMPQPDAYKRRGSARDAMTAFQQGFADWQGAGRDQVIAALDLSELNEAVRDYEGELAAQYLREVLDRIGSIVPQEIPDDPASREPYVAFSHPLGTIAIEPVGTGNQLSWKFSASTVRTARDLFIAVEDMPVLSSRPRPTAASGYFRLRGWVRDRSPALLKPIGILELWQVLGWIAVLCASFALACALRALIQAGLGRFGEEDDRRFGQSMLWPLRLAFTFSIYKLLIPAIGLPESFKRLSVGKTGVLLALALMWGGWLLIEFLGKLQGAEASVSTLDNIVVSLAFGALKLALIGSGLVFIAIELSLPYESVLAGLSIGGLAVAFASKETLSNVFGAGILAVDRPFKRGDWIIAGDVQGTVENVGIRSTRIRTGDDSLVIVPNGKLSDALVNNLGTRRYHLNRAKLLVCYDASVAQLEDFSAGLKTLVGSMPGAVPQRTDVSVKALGRERIEIELTLCLDGRSGVDEGSLLNGLVLDILRLAERLGVRLGDQAAGSAADPLPATP